MVVYDASITAGADGEAADAGAVRAHQIELPTGPVCPFRDEDQGAAVAAAGGLVVTSWGVGQPPDTTVVPLHQVDVVVTVAVGMEY